MLHAVRALSAQSENALDPYKAIAVLAALMLVLLLFAWRADNRSTSHRRPRWWRRKPRRDNG